MSTLQHATPNRSGKFIFQVLATFLPVALLTCGAAYYFYYSTQDRVAFHNRTREAVVIEIGQSAISNALQEIRRDLLLVSEHYALKNFLDQPVPAEIRDFEQDMLNLSSSRRLYDQICWLDETGMERVRVDFNNGNPVIATALALQNERTRYYFPAAFKLERGEAYISSLDLNIEHERIETPYKPMLRIGTPVFDSHGDKRGIVLLNFLGAELLERFGKATADIADHAMLLNQDGYWLKSPKPEDAWGFMFGRDQLTLARRHPIAWQRILAADSGQFEDAEGLWTFKTIYPGLEGQKTPERNALADRAAFWKVVAHLPPHALYGSQPLLKPMLAALAALLLLQLAGSWKLVRVRRLRNEAQDQVRQTNRNLERLVEERTVQLQADINLRKRAEEALRESEEKLHLFIEHAPAALAMFDREMRYLAVSRRWMTDYGLDDGGEVIGRSHYEVFPEILDCWKTVHRRGLSGEVVRADDECFERFDGSVQWLRWEVRPWYTTSGIVGGIVIFTEDITERKLAEEKLRTLSTAVEQAPISVVITDLEANVRYVNPRFTEVTGYSADEVIGQNPRILQSKLTPKETYRDMWDTLTGGRVWHGELINIRKNGEIYWEEAHITPVVNAAGATTHYVGVKLDVTERKQAEERLRQAAAVFEGTREGIIVTDTEQRILRVNPAFCELTGYTEAEVAGKKPSVLSSGRQGRDFYAAMWASLKATGHWQGEIWNRRKNGEVYPELLSISAITDDTGQVGGYVGVFADISKLKSSEAELEFIAHHDPLTRLPNRLLLLSRLEHGIGLARRENRQLALLMLDLDRFKDVNDSFGHLAGDELLQQAAARLTERLRGVDTVTRLGGDEFTVLLEDIAYPEDAARVADEIIVALSEPWQLANGVEVRIGASVGISLFPQHGNSAEELLQQADAALYQAKAEGRGRFTYFSEDLTCAARERIELEVRLRRAIAQNELRVFYQPQVDIASGRIIGAEALVRWQDPLEGLILPVRFIPVAEATGLISAVGEWVLKETCLQGRRWIEAGLPPLTLAVNVSPHQFLSSDLVGVVSRTLAETSFPAAWLELELTESALMNRQQEAVDMLNRLRAIGVRLAIDDFGTGYSSLAYLKRFPLDVLKIDKSFVDDIPDSQDDREIAAAIVAMGHTLRFKVLAEGVETVEQLAFLQGQGCDSYQGYLKSPPLPPDAFAKLLAES